MQSSKFPGLAKRSGAGKVKSFCNLVNFAFLIAIFNFSFLIFNFGNAFALTDDCSKSSIPFNRLDACISEIENEVNALKPAQERNKQELEDLKKQIADIKKQITNLTNRVNQLEKDILTREEDLALQEELLKQRVRSFYIRSREYSPFTVFLSSVTATRLTHELVLRSQVADQDREIIEKLALELSQLKQDKSTLEKSKTGLQRVQATLDQRAGFLSKEVEKVETYIASLSAKQQQLLAQKAGGFETSVGDTPPTLEPCTGPPGSSNYCDPGFTGFAAFAFGAPHRKGMSQFGAKGRAEAGQSTEDILKAYYGNIKIETRSDLPSIINTTAGTLPFEENYLMGIAEMPSTWNINALKAQAIAARTYALSYIGWRNANPNGATGKICTTEACQVYRSSKASSPPDAWRQAVSETKGQLILSNSTNEIISSWYASTAGGYTFSYTTLGHSTPGMWDTDGGKDKWPDSAYDKKGGSPWFYKAWYKTRSGKDCGRSHPWLKEEELSDILNAWHVLENGGGDTSRISPIDTNCWSGNPYSVSELASIAGYTKVASVSVVYGNDGSTLEVAFSTNKGSVSLSGESFKKAFNLRAPGFIGIKSSLFNIVKTN